MQRGRSPGPGRAPHHAAGSHRGWGKPGMSSCHSLPPAPLIPLPAPSVAAALLLPPPPHIPSLSRDPPLAQSLPLVPEKPCKTVAAWSCSRVLAPSCPPHLTASHRSPRHEGGSHCREPLTTIREAKPGLGRERKTGCTPHRRAAFCCTCIPHHRRQPVCRLCRASPAGTPRGFVTVAAAK